MKKIVLIIVLAIAYSCTQEDSAVEMQSVTVSADMNTTPTLTGKPVKRGSIFASISAIRVKNTCSEWSYTNYTDFDIVEDGTTNATTTYTLDNVYSGINVFTATTTTDVIPTLTLSTKSRATGTIDNNNTEIKNVFVTEEAKNPYALYTELNPVTADIIIGTAQNISIPMKTSNSRIIAYFSLLDLKGPNASNSVTVEIYKGGTVTNTSGTLLTYGGYSYRNHGNQSNSNINLISSGVKIGANVTANAATDGVIYLSNDTEIAGDTITFRIIHYDRTKYDIYYFSTKLKSSNTGSFLFAINDKVLSIWGM
jgi:hypothetical protein